MRTILLESALTVLQNDGAAALTVRNIAEKAGCSTTGIYTHFGGKNGLVEAIYIDGFESFDQALSEPLADGDLEEAGMVYRRWALENRTHYLVMFGRAVPDFQPSDKAQARALQSFVRLRDVVADGGVDDPDRAAYHLYANVHGHVMLELVDMRPIDSIEPVELYRSGLVRMLSLLAG